MSIFNIFTKDKPSNIQWTIRVAEDEILIDNPDTFPINLDNYLTDLEMNDIEFIVLAPSQTLNNLTFLQVANNNDGYMHVEAGLDEKNSMGRPKILYKDNITTGECYDMFWAFYKTGKIDVSGWKELE